MTSTKPNGDPLRVDSLVAGYGKRRVIDDIDLRIARGSITTLIGPNGSGKSTLLKAMARILKPIGGSVFLDGEAIATLPSREIARRMAILPQSPTIPEALTVRQLIEQGRYPHVGVLRMLRQQDHEAIDAAIEATGMGEFLERHLDELSGGERQRAWIALALAQDTPVLLLDEPTTYLDLGHQLEVLDVVSKLNQRRGLTIVMVLHDLNQAARYSDRLIALSHGHVVADGTPTDVLNESLLENTFRIKAAIITDPNTGAPVCLPTASLGSVRSESAVP